MVDEKNTMRTYKIYILCKKENLIIYLNKKSGLYVRFNKI